MPTIHRFIVRNISVAVLALAAVFTPRMSLAQEPLSVDDIIGSLKASSGESPTTLSADDIIGRLQNAIEVLSEGNDAGRETEETTARNDLSTLEQLPTVEIQIFFAYKSAAVESKSFPDLMRLGQALLDPRLGKSRFVIGGHTDSIGSSTYNLKLSQQRADSVREFLLAAFPDIGPERLVSLGFGEEHLADAAKPEDPVNRRVQVANVGEN